MGLIPIGRISFVAIKEIAKEKIMEHKEDIN
jgi:hypothetical protein